MILQLEEGNKLNVEKMVESAIFEAEPTKAKEIIEECAEKGSIDTFYN